MKHKSQLQEVAEQLLDKYYNDMVHLLGRTEGLDEFRDRIEKVISAATTNSLDAQWTIRPDAGSYPDLAGDGNVPQYMSLCYNSLMMNFGQIQGYGKRGH